MAGQFVLRSENDATNPFAARLYGQGITGGRVVFYQNSGTGSQTVFLAILAQGARSAGDLGCGGALRVYYAGFELPEFTGLVRNWRFHKGTVASPPNYKAIQSVDHTTEIWTVNGHGYTSGDLIAFHRRGADVIPPATTPNLFDHTQYMAYVIDANHIKVLRQTSGAPDTANTMLLTDNGTNIDRLFVYRANAFLFDPAQGRPEFFSGLNFTFSGLSYIEVRLPVYLSDGEDEPSKLKVKMDGKEMYGLQIVSGALAFDTGTITTEPNPALVSVDALYGDAKLPLSRFHAQSFLDWRDRADATIPWVGGNDNPAPRTSWTLTNMTYDLSQAKLTNAGGGGVGYAMTEQFSAVYPSVECRYTGTPFGLYFTQTNVPTDTTQQGLEVRADGKLYAINQASGFEIMPCNVGDRFKVAYENGLLVVYRNGIPMPLVNVGQQQLYTQYYVKVKVDTAAGYIDQVYVAPSGTNSTPRQVKRFYGGFAAVEATAVVDLFDTEVNLCPGTSWADIDGQLRICNRPDRTPCYTFVFDPANADASNVHKVTIRRKNPEEVPNFYRYTYRDLDDPVLSRKPAFIDRKERRAGIGGRLVDPGLIQYGVLPTSQIERIGETIARLNTDLDIFFTVEGFLDSLPVVKGSFVYVADIAHGYSLAAPAKCIVNDIRYQIGADVETIIYECQIITDDFYSDSAHGAVTPVGGSGAGSNFTPPPIADALTLEETTEPLPDNRYISSISGVVDFGNAVAQHARIFTKVLGQKYAAVTYNSGSNTFTLVAGTDNVMPPTTLPLSIGSTANNLPGGASIEREYYAVNVSGNTFKLSHTQGGAAVSFTSNGGSVGIYAYVPWGDTLIDVYPDNVTNNGGFELIPARKSLTYVRAVTRSAGDASLSFELHRTALINVVGDATPPTAPAFCHSEYDGVRLRFFWAPSPTFAVRGYLITDEADRVVSQTGANELSYVQTAQADRVTRRIYSVGSSGVLSTGYAEVTWIKPPETSWVNVQGLTINADNTLTKTASTGWGNAGATLSHAVVTDRVSTRLSGAPDRANTYQIMGFSYLTDANGIEDFEFGVYFQNDGTVSAYYNNGATNTFLGTYSAGQRYMLDVEPSIDPFTIPSIITVKRLDFVNGYPVETLLHTFPAATLRQMPLYPAVALYTVDSTSSLDLQLSGDLIPTQGTPPPAIQDGVGVVYNPTTGVLKNVTGSSGYGSAGAFFPQPLLPFADGGWLFTIGEGKAAIGVSTTNTDEDNDTISYRIERAPDHSANIYFGASLVATTTIAPGTPVFIGQESGVILVRVAGVLINYNTNVIFSEATKYLDTAFDGDYLSTEIAIKRYDAVGAEQQNLTGEVIPVTVDVRESVRVGENKAVDIPGFAIEVAEKGAALEFNEDGKVATGRQLPLALFDLTEDVPTTGTAIQTLYQYDVNGGTLRNHDKVVMTFAGSMAANSNNKRLFPTIGTDVLMTVDLSNAALTDWVLTWYVIRVSNTVAKYGIVFSGMGVTPVVESGELTGLDFEKGTLELKLDGRSVTAAGELTLQSAYGEIKPYASQPASTPPIGLLSSVSAGAVGKPDVETDSIDTTGATLLVVVTSSYNPGGLDIPVVTDNMSNSWISLTPSGGSNWCQIHYCENPTTDPTHTFTVTTSAGFPAIYAAAFSHTKAAGAVDKENAADGGSGGINTGAIEPSRDFELVVAGVAFTGNSNQPTVDNDFEVIQFQPFDAGNTVGGAMAIKIQEAAHGENPEWITSENHNGAAIASFKHE